MTDATNTLILYMNTLHAIYSVILDVLETDNSVKLSELEKDMLADAQSDFMLGYNIYNDAYEEHPSKDGTFTRCLKDAELRAYFVTDILYNVKLLLSDFFHAVIRHTRYEKTLNIMETYIVEHMTELLTVEKE